MLKNLADVWIARAARPDDQALARVAGMGPAAVITGASRGIGLEIARELASRGSPILLIARNATDLENAANTIRDITQSPIFTLSLDVTHTDAPFRIDECLRGNGLYADLVVNNAGVGLSGSFAAADPQALDDLLALNMTALTRLMRHYLEAMLARGRGGILNVASLGGLVPGPYQAAYYASKAYVISLTQAAATEASGRGVRISVLAPGPVRTHFHADMGADRALYRYLIPELSAARVAKSACFWFLLGRRLIVPGIMNTILALALRILPYSLTAPIVAWLLVPPRAGEHRQETE